MTVRRNNDVRHKVVVARQNAFWIAVRLLVAGQLPDNDGLVWRSVNDQKTAETTDKYHGKLSESYLGSLKRLQWP